MKRLIIVAVVVALVVGVTALFPAPSIVAAQITEIIDSTGDGMGNTLNYPEGIAVDGNGNVYVAGIDSDNAFKITSGGVITEIIDSTGDGTGNTLYGPADIAVDGNGNVYVTGAGNNNAFKITAPLPVGGIAEFPAVAGPAGTSGMGSGTYAVLAGGAAGVLAFAVLGTLAVKRRGVQQ